MKPRALRTAGLGALIAVLALVVGQPLQAQQQDQEDAQSAETPTIEKEELRTYARAYVKVADVRSGLKQRLAQASGQEEQARIRQEANREMQSILQDAGLTVKRYQEITSVLNADPRQRETFTAMVEEIQADDEDDGGGSGGR